MTTTTRQPSLSPGSHRHVHRSDRIASPSPYGQLSLAHSCSFSLAGARLRSLAGLYSVFSSREALDKYAVSEAHVKVVTENVRPNVDGESESSVSSFGFETEPIRTVDLGADRADVMAYDWELDE